MVIEVKSVGSIPDQYTSRLGSWSDAGKLHVLVCIRRHEEEFMSPLLPAGFGLCRSMHQVSRTLNRVGRLVIPKP